MTGPIGPTGPQGVISVQGATGFTGPIGPAPISGAPYYGATRSIGVTGWADPKVVHGPQNVSNGRLKHEFVLDPIGTWRDVWQCANCGMRIESPRGANFQEILKIATRCSESAVQEVIDL